MASVACSNTSKTTQKPFSQQYKDDDKQTQVENFKLEAQTALDAIQACKEMKRRQIERTFASILDNMTTRQKNMPVNECFDDFLKLLRREKLIQEIPKLAADENTEDQDQDMSEYFAAKGKKKATTCVANDEDAIIIDDDDGDDDQHDKSAQNRLKNLTSTTKKADVPKAKLAKQQHVPLAALEEHSVIQPVAVTDSKRPTTIVSAATSTSKPHTTKVQYALNTGIKVSVKLANLASVDLSMVHEDCRDEMTQLVRVFSEVSRLNKLSSD